MVGPSKTRQEQAYKELRSDILAGRLKPGEKLPFAELCANYSVSVGVIRESLTRLSEQGLVAVEPQQGFRVVPISKTDLVHLTEARREIEALTLRHAMKEGGYAWESQVLAAHHRLARQPRLDPADHDRLSDEWVEAHAEFHDTLLSGCGNPRLRAIAKQLRDSGELYRRWSVPLGLRPERDIEAEHQAIVDAVLAGEVEQASELLDRHISLTTELLLASHVVQFSDPQPSPAA